MEITPAHINDGDMGPSLLGPLAKRGFMERVNYAVADAGYDQRKNYEAVAPYDAQAIIPLNLRNEKIPPATFSFPVNPRCSMGYDMIYWGCDGD